MEGYVFREAGWVGSQPAAAGFAAEAVAMYAILVKTSSRGYVDGWRKKRVFAALADAFLA
jgi:hypothetical protein